MEPTPASAPESPSVVTIDRRTAILLGVFILIGIFLFAASKPPLPVTVRWRKALLDHTTVLVIRLNEGQSSPLRVKITYRDNSLNQVKNAYVDLHPGEVDVGHLEGFPFLAGDTAELSNSRFSTLTVTVPSR